MRSLQVVMLTLCLIGGLYLLTQAPGFFMPDRWDPSIGRQFSPAASRLLGAALLAMAAMGAKKGWGLDLGAIAGIWRGGCIIRARFLQKITEAFEKKPRLANLLLDPYFKKTVKKAQKNWRKVIALAVKHGIPVPTLGSALSYFDSYRTENLPQNLLQGQRDFFGAHTYERKDKPRGEFFHIDWPDPKRPQIKA